MESFLDQANSLHSDPSKSDGLRESAWGIYHFIKDELYLNREDLTIKGERLNATLLMSLLTGISQGKELIIGEPGLGKTTSAEYVCVLLFRLPLATVWKSEVSGHPEQTEEKIIGRPDLGRLNQGEETVIWSYFTLLPTKIVDELNRLPETKQSMILEGVDRGKWEYLNDAIINPEYCFFATANYHDRGTFTIIAPLIDRFDVMVESKHPGANLAYRIGMQASDGHMLRNVALENEFHQILRQQLPYFEKMVQVEALCDKFGDILTRKIGVKTLSKEDRQAIRTQKGQIPFDLDANAFLRLVLSELSFCHRFGQKRSHEICEEGCHFSGYLCNAVKNCMSNRFAISIQSFSQALAWLMGDEKVDLEHLKAVLPFTLAHRIQWKEKTLARYDNKIRSDPLALFMAKAAVMDIHRRYMEQGPRIKDALAIACRIAEGEALEPLEGDHPIYWEIRKDLGEEQFDE